MNIDEFLFHIKKYFLNLKMLYSGKEKLSVETTSKHFYPSEFEYLSRRCVKFIKKIILKKKTIKISFGLNTAGLGIFVLDFKKGDLVAARRYYNNELYDEYSYDSYSIDKSHFYIFTIDKSFDFINFIVTILLSADRVCRKHYALNSSFQSSVAYQMIYYNKITTQNKTTFHMNKIDTFFNGENCYLLCSCNMCDNSFKSYNHKGILRGDVTFDDKLIKKAVLYDCFGSEFLTATYYYENTFLSNISILLHNGLVFNINKDNKTIKFPVTLTDKHIEYLNEISDYAYKDLKSCSGEYTIIFNDAGLIKTTEITLSDNIELDDYFSSMLFVLPRALRIQKSIRGITENLNPMVPILSYFLNPFNK